MAYSETNLDTHANGERGGANLYGVSGFAPIY